MAVLCFLVQNQPQRSSKNGEKLSCQDLSEYTEINHRRMGRVWRGSWGIVCSFHYILRILFACFVCSFDFDFVIIQMIHVEWEQREASNIKTEKWDRAYWCLFFNSSLALWTSEANCVFWKFPCLWNNNWTVHKRNQNCRK